MKFNEIEIEECKFHKSKSPISINDIHINKTALVNKILNISLVINNNSNAMMGEVSIRSLSKRNLIKHTWS